MNCVKCGIHFDGRENKLYKKDCCAACYRLKFYTPKKVMMSKISPTCIECGVEFDQSNPIQAHASGGRCKKCYNKILYGTKVNHCPECNANNKSTVSMYCKLCRIYAKGLVRTKVDPTSKDYEVVRLILNRYKFGTNSSIDDFRVASLFLDYFVTAKELDSFSPQEQVRFMLKSLKWLYDGKSSKKALHKQRR